MTETGQVQPASDALASEGVFVPAELGGVGFRAGRAGQAILRAVRGGGGK